MPRMTLAECMTTIRANKRTIEEKDAEIRGLKAEAQADRAQLDRIARRCVDLVDQNTYLKERLAENRRYTRAIVWLVVCGTIAVLVTVAGVMLCQ